MIKINIIGIKTAINFASPIKKTTESVGNSNFLNLYSQIENTFTSSADQQRLGNTLIYRGAQS